MSDAADVRKMLVQSYRDLEAHLKDNQEIIWTFFQPTREVRLAVGSIGSVDAGTLRIAGYDLDDKPMIMVLHHTHVSSALEIIATEKRNRVGFTIDL